MNARRSTKRSGVLIGAAAALTLAAGSGFGSQFAPPPPTDPNAADPWSLLGSFPPGVDAAAVLDAPGERLFTDPAARTVRAALARTGMFSQTVRAWSGLAAALGYTEDEAAAALLGRRVIVAWDGLMDHAGGLGGALVTANRLDTRWVFIAEVDKQTALALRARLKAAPRRTVAGKVIYTVDAGRIAMAVAEDAAGTRVLIAPVGATGLLDAMLTGPAANAEPAPDPAASGTPPGSDLGTRARAVLGNVEPGWAGVAAVRVPGSERPAAFELRSAKGAWGARFASEVPFSGPESSGPGAPVGVLAAAGGDALFAAAFSGGPGLSDGTLDVRMRIGEPPDTPADPDPDPDPLRYDRGSVVVLHAAEAGRTPDATVAAVLQVITHAASSRPFAERVDRLISAAIGGENPPAHRGLFPGAVRSHAIDAVLTSGTDETPDPGLWPGDGARVAWSMAPDPADRSGVVSIAVGSSGSDPDALARKGREAWERGADDFDPTMLTAGRARPAALAEALKGSAGGPLMDLARSVDRIEWTVRSVQGLTRGEVLFRLADPASRLGAP